MRLNAETGQSRNARVHCRRSGPGKRSNGIAIAANASSERRKEPTMAAARRRIVLRCRMNVVV
jgi:hypothetical protein